MLRLVLTGAFGLFFSCSYGQLKKFYTLKETVRIDTVDFSLEATSGNCYIKSSPDAEGLTIYGNPDLNKINPSFKSSVENGKCDVALDLQEYRSSNFADGLLMAMVREKVEENNYWKILFDQEKVYRLNLSYGFGNADVDLSGASIQNFKVRSGSADIIVDYNDRNPNKIQMDTFWVKADMGSVVARHLELAKARYVMANIGFGRALLDFGASTGDKCLVEASVGAGNLDVYLPREDVPIIIYLSDSPLCGRRMVDGFEEVERNVFVNMNYSSEAEDLITFRIDVSLGNVAFHYN